MRPSIKNVHRELLKNLGEHREYAEDTLRAIDSDVGVFARYVEETLGKDVDAANALNRKMLLEFLGGGEISPATKRRRLFSLRLFTAYAVEQEWIDEDPLQGVGIADLLADKERVRPSVLSEEQIEVMIEETRYALGNADPFPMLMMGVLLSGLRVSESVDLKWNDILVDEDGSISFAIDSRNIPLSSRISQDAFLVAVHIGRRRLDDQVLAVKRRALSDRFGEFLNRVGLYEDLHPKDLRWRYMLDLVQEGYTEDEIGSICGVTSSYVRRLFPEVAKGLS